MKKQVKLYVKSAKTPEETVMEGSYTTVLHSLGSSGGQGARGETWGAPPHTFSTYREFEQKTPTGYVLPEDQEEAIELLEEIAPKCGFEVVVVDLTRISRFSRAFRKEFRELNVLPMLKASSGRTLTTFTKQDVEAFLFSETASAVSTL